MSDETSKAILRRQFDSAYATTYFVGRGIDVGAGRDGLDFWKQKFPLMESCYGWDLKDGDAQYLQGVKNASFDFVHSAHCLEHMLDPREAIINWWRVLKPGGHLVVIVPDADLYEQGVWPSRYNQVPYPNGHNSRFTMRRMHTASKIATFYVPDLIPDEGMLVKLLRLEGSYYFGLPEDHDQTLGLGESAIEFVVRKPDPDGDPKLHGYPLNDEDREALKKANGMHGT